MLDIFDFISDNKKYTYIDTIQYNDKNYVAYMDDDNVYISEYTMDKDGFILDDISDELYEILIREMKL